MPVAGALCAALALLAPCASLSAPAAPATFRLDLRPGLRLELAANRTELIIRSGLNIGDDGAK